LWQKNVIKGSRDNVGASKNPDHTGRQRLFSNASEINGSTIPNFNQQTNNQLGYDST
jgi:hypothetical protein